MKQKKQTKKTSLKLDSKDKYDPLNLSKSKLDKEQKVKKYKYGDYISKWSIQYWQEKMKKHFRKQHMYLILMQLRNGKYSMFTIATASHYFSYGKGMYFLDADMSREDIHTGLQMFYYHQDVMCPFKIDFNINKLRESLESYDDHITKAINPQNVKGFINAEVIEKVLKGQALSDDIKFLRTLLTINLILTAGVIVVMAKTMGWI